MGVRIRTRDSVGVHCTSLGGKESATTTATQQNSQRLKRNRNGVYGGFGAHNEDFPGFLLRQIPLAPLSDDVSRLSSEIRSISDELLNHLPPTPGDNLLLQEVDGEVPHKIDENLWKNREHIEEILFLLERSHWPSALQQQSTLDDAELAVIFDS
ncbi:hypothetical protein FNV43_RR09661 [Rhamnella rubrinervis]|uniref:Uncharacterized protein n=1 Tax=Rhamnella rubrinervis TaxID=2594499 RepID=A0A8K0MKE9_9ROSA|nr:hypothetical protein FNV43_RR09661 [Rhamnella rubrinervis]